MSPKKLRRWAQQNMIPAYDATWTPAAVGYARVVTRMRERGHSLKSIRQATAEGRLAFGYIEELFPSDDRLYTRADAARETGLAPPMIERIAAVRLKGFSEPTEIFVVRQRAE